MPRLETFLQDRLQKYDGATILALIDYDRSTRHLRKGGTPITTKLVLPTQADLGFVPDMMTNLLNVTIEDPYYTEDNIIDLIKKHEYEQKMLMGTNASLTHILENRIQNIKSSEQTAETNCLISYLLAETITEYNYPKCDSGYNEFFPSPPEPNYEATSIDLEGLDLDVLEGLTPQTHNFVEYNNFDTVPTQDNHMDYTEEEEIPSLEETLTNWENRANQPRDDLHTPSPSQNDFSSEDGSSEDDSIEMAVDEACAIDLSHKPEYTVSYVDINGGKKILIKPEPEEPFPLLKKALERSPPSKLIPTIDLTEDEPECYYTRRGVISKIPPTKKEDGTLRTNVYKFFECYRTDVYEAPYDNFLFMNVSEERSTPQPKVIQRPSDRYPKLASFNVYGPDVCIFRAAKLNRHYCTSEPTNPIDITTNVIIYSEQTDITFVLPSLVGTIFERMFQTSEVTSFRVPRSTDKYFSYFIMPYGLYQLVNIPGDHVMFKLVRVKPDTDQTCKNSAHSGINVTLDIYHFYPYTVHLSRNRVVDVGASLMSCLMFRIALYNNNLRLSHQDIASSAFPKTQKVNILHMVGKPKRNKPPVSRNHVIEAMKNK